MVKILGISASPRKQATEYIVKQALEAAAEYDPSVEIEYAALRDYHIQPCCHCDFCFKTGKCIRKDGLEELFEKVLDADGVIFGSPVYSYNPTPEAIMFFNRMRVWRNNFPADRMEYKVGGAITVGGTRNGGQEMTTNAIINMFLAREMLEIGGSSGYYTGPKIWTDNKNAEGAIADLKGVDSARDLGRRMAKTVLKLKGE